MDVKHSNKGGGTQRYRSQNVIDSKFITVLFRKYRQLNVKKVVIRVERDGFFIYLQIWMKGTMRTVSTERADKIILERRIESLALHRSRKRLGKEMRYADMNPIERKIVSLTAKKWRILVSIKKRREAERATKDRRGKPRHRLRTHKERSVDVKN
ncbi:hypothetical protein THOM_2663 [Trachipleistophora hominis]|uniref:Uncharacterized protein n=1 Tax=Trachipleistophora hominis TaxID=72359 RepID=L7JSM3_TRAHO|nr:hypothetical protein THOM_2663 [Trachipleistophora hominis]